MNKIRATLLTLLILTWTGAFAKVSFQLIPRQNVVSGTNFQITFRLTVEDEQLSNASMPKAPELENCRLLSGPNQTTSQRYTTIINGRESTSALIDLTCMYRAGDPGKVKIPSVTINVGGKAYSTAEGSFEILPPDKNSDSSGGGSAASQGGQVNTRDYFVRVIFSKSSVYEQEGVIATTKLYRPANVRSGIRLEAVPSTPVYEGFLSEDLDSNPEAQMENFNGKNYYTYELSRVLLFPQKSGELKVTSGTYTLKIQEQVGVISMHGFPTARYEEINYTTPLATGVINVKSLPEPQPLNFCGAVGSFSLSASLSPEIIRTNESATYSLAFKGTGNVKYLTVPTVEFPSTFDKYSAKTDIQANVSGQTYVGSYIVNFPIVPQEVGKFEIPAQTFSYFDLASQNYVELSVPAFPIDVKRGAAVAVGGEQKEVDTSMNDILHINPVGDVITPAPMPVFAAWWFWTLWGLGIAALVVAIFVYRRQLKLNADVAGRRNSRANRVVSKRFKSVAALMKAHNDDKFYDMLATAVKGYLSDKLGIPQSSLISDTIASKLSDYGASPELVESVLQVLDECEMARFTPSHSESAMSELFGKATSAVKSIENIKSKGK